MNIIFYLFTGLIVGAFSGLLGIGGGIILIPILVLGYGLSAQTAVGTSLIALLLPVGALGVWEFWRSGRITSENFKMGFLIAIGIFFGVYLGSKVALAVPEKVLRYFFAFTLFSVGIRFLFK